MVGRETRLVDVSHTVEDGLITYRGLPAPIVCDYLSREESKQHYAEGTQFQIGKIEMVANTGTYVDSPYHRYADGKDLSELPLSSLADLSGIVIDCDNCRIDVEVFDGLDFSEKAVLVRTGWSRHWNTDQHVRSSKELSWRAWTEFRRHVNHIHNWIYKGEAGKVFSKFGMSCFSSDLSSDCGWMTPFETGDSTADV